jgi:hypothetical protein
LESICSINDLDIHKPAFWSLSIQAGTEVITPLFLASKTTPMVPIKLHPSDEAHLLASRSSIIAQYFGFVKAKASTELSPFPISQEIIMSGT